MLCKPPSHVVIFHPFFNLNKPTQRICAGCSDLPPTDHGDGEEGVKNGGKRAWVKGQVNGRG